MNKKYIGIGIIITVVPWTIGLATAKYLEWASALPEGTVIESVQLNNEPTASRDRGSKKRPTKSTKSESSYVQSIVNRSIFDSTQVKEDAVETQVVNSDEGTLTDLEVTLLGTVVAIPPEYSVALIKDNRSNTSSPYGVGDNILNEGQIIRVEQKKVVIKRNNNEIEYIEISGDEEDGKKAGKSSAGKGEEDSGVTKEGPNKYIIDQAVLDQLLENPEQLASQVRVIPHKDESDNIDGYRLSGIRRNSIFYKLGVKNGDIIHDVNGMPLNSMSSAMDAYNSLGSSKNFSFEITRRRQKQNFEYEVR
jgi:type II secretion system protein C